MELFIILAAVVIFACIILNKISHKLGIPMLLAFIVLSLMEGKNSLSMNLYVIFAQVVYGGVCGIIIAYFASKFLKKHNFATDGFDTIFVFAYAL